jgi:hypothetical protein
LHDAVRFFDIRENQACFDPVLIVPDDMIAPAPPWGLAAGDAVKVTKLAASAGLLDVTQHVLTRLPSSAGGISVRQRQSLSRQSREAPCGDEATAREIIDQAS